ncbi:GNAT family N-acetyltransferase [Gynuella sunshinyii]|uniref:Putative acetyltransferase n=1 Tax=Gynuella sunshinyii YC6258 TaxID=1445510 RepID=A0A0C5V200_9GAMM|nr:GNAT family N-acetyltransferase [Gynuella sunshinyii]AJQ93575.1 putative acetyltransferase [Gynuella sunshinyii YC6258]
MPIKHDTEKKRFTYQPDTDQHAFLSYTLSDNHINFIHTFVPESLRGQGIAEKLVREGLSWAKHEDFVISASCSYVQRFI